MFFILKLGLLTLYVAALAGFAGLLQIGATDRLQQIALILLAIHVLELLVMFRHVRRYPGPLAVSLFLTILFGMLHWKPLADEYRKTRQPQQHGGTAP